MTPGGRTRRASEWGQDGTWLASASPPLGWARGGALACELAQERSRCAVPDRRHVGSLSPVRPLVQSCTHRDQGRGGPDAQSGSGVSLSPLTMWISTQSQCSRAVRHRSDRPAFDKIEDFVGVVVDLSDVPVGIGKGRRAVCCEHDPIVHSDRDDDRHPPPTQSCAGITGPGPPDATCPVSPNSSTRECARIVTGWAVELMLAHTRTTICLPSSSDAGTKEREIVIPRSA